MTPRNHALQIVRDAGPAIAIGSSAAAFLRVPPPERFGGADAEAGNDEDNPRSGDVVKPRQPIATRLPTRGAAREKIRHVGADGPGKTAQPRTRDPDPPQRCERRQRGCGIAAAAAESSLYGDALRDGDHDVSWRARPPRRPP